MEPTPCRCRRCRGRIGSEEIGNGSCRSVVFLPVLFVGGCGLLVFLFATGIIKQSDAYKIALARAQANPAVIEAIGSPISQTGIVSGNSNVTGPTGQASLSIPLSGPKGKATLYVEAMKSADIWVFQTMVVKIEKTGERIDLNKLPRQ